MKQLAVALATLLAATAGLAADKVFVVTSDQAAFAEAARAAAEVLGASAQLVRADDDAKATLATAEVVVAVGPLAARLVGTAAPTARIVACLAPKLSGEKAIGVPLNAAPGDVLGVARQLMPGVGAIGVFPSSARASAELLEAASVNGIKLDTPRPGEAFAASVDRMLASTDAIWIDDLQSIPDGGAALVVKAASEQRLLVIAPNRSTVLQGAFFAVVPDPAEHGRAAGEAARRIADGQDVRKIAAPTGRVVINGLLARSAQTKLSPALARRSELVE